MARRFIIRDSEKQKRRGDKVEDGEYLSKEDKARMEALKKELAELKAEHKNFAKNKGGLTPEDRERWRQNSQRTNEVYVEIKELRFKNIMDAGKGGKL
jgi:hypothetical protein